MAALSKWFGGDSDSFQLGKMFLGAGAYLTAGQAERSASRMESASLERQAQADIASSQREAIDVRRNARYAKSRAVALAAASGGGADDPTVQNITSEIEAEGEYGALSALYSGQERAAGLREQAAVRKKMGKAAATAGYLRAGATVLDTGSSLYEKYG